MIVLAAKNFIAGRWLEAEPAIESLDPADRQTVIATCPASGPEMVDAAIQAARKAWVPWRERTAVQRAEPIDLVVQSLRRYGRELAKCVTAEIGLTAAEATQEVDLAIRISQQVAGLCREPAKWVTPLERPGVRHEFAAVPYGVVAVLTPYISSIVRTLAAVLPALLAGNAVVWKPSEEAPGCAHWLARVFLESGYPDGAVNVLYGNEQTGRLLATHAGVDALFFAGSRAAAREVALAVAGETRLHVILQSEGKNVAIVAEDADLDRAAASILQSAFGGAGQLGRSIDHVYAVPQVRDRLTEAIVAGASALKVGNGREPGTQMGPLGAVSALERWESRCRKVVDDGGAVLLRDADRAPGDGLFALPVVVQGPCGDGEPTRGPLLIIEPVDDPLQAVARHNALPTCNVLAVYAASCKTLEEISRMSRASQVFMNVATTLRDPQLAEGLPNLGGVVGTLRALSRTTQTLRG